jgi:hypothetical protein
MRKKRKRLAKRLLMLRLLLIEVRRVLLLLWVLN